MSEVKRIRIHVTDRSNFKYCRRYYWFNSIMRVVPQTQAYSGKYWFGNWGHLALAKHYESGKNITPDEAIYEALTKERESSPEDKSLVLGVLNHYGKFYKHEDEWEILGVEVELTKEFPDLVPGCTIILVGTVDLVIRWRGVIWIVDHKFYSSMPETSRLEIDDQMSAYLYLAAENYPEEKIAGAIYNVIKKAVPEKPSFLTKSGRLSKDKTQNTTVALIREAIEELCLDESDYSDFIAYYDSLERDGQGYFRRFPIRRGKLELKNWEDDLKAELTEICSPSTRFYPNPTWECSNCEYLIPCKMKNEGSDVEGVLRQFFVPKVGRE